MSLVTPTGSARAQRRAARRRAHHLIAADENGLAELQAVVATLPLCATGRIFIEVADAEAIGRLDAPPRMTVTWLARSQRSGAPGTARACAKGAALTRAVCAWADEMLCDAEDPTQITLLAGYLATADIVEHLTDDLAVPAEDIHAPAQFAGLLRTDR